MKTAITALLLAQIAASAEVSAGSPIGKVLELLSNLQAKIVADGEKSHQVFSQFAEWCEDRSRNLGFEVSTATAEIADLKATIQKEAALTETLSTKVEELTGSVATNQADLKAAAEIRAREQADFAAEERELTEIVDTLQRAITILEREMQKTGAVALQLKQADSVTKALGVLVESSAIGAADASRLTALLQSSQAPDEEPLGAPEPAAYKSQSGSIVATLEDLLSKAESQLAEARKTETSNLHNYELLKQSLEDQVKFATADLDEAKKGIAVSGETKSTAEGDLAATSKDLAADEADLADLHRDCTAKAQDYEAEVKSRDEELKAIAEAKAVISEKTGGAEAVAYGTSLLQVGRASSAAPYAVVRFVRRLAEKQNIPALAQLATRMASAIRAGVAAGEDPFAKVRALISDLIQRLEAEASSDSSHKAYCDKELAETVAKKEEKTAEIEKLTTRIDRSAAESAKLKEEVAALQAALAALAKSQAEMDKLRQEEHDIYVSNKKDVEEGLQGIKMALSILREYYSKEGKAHQASEGAGSSIIGLLEVVESDLTKNFAEIEATESAAQASYDKETKENTIERTSKEQDVKYKTKEAADLDKALAEDSSDRSGVQAELDAVLEYLTKLHEMCDERAEPYEARKQRREAEIQGLKEALSILEGEAALLQRSSSRASLRGVSRH